nr:helicase C-terminal domain-containing protein [Alcanivorax sp. 1008]
MAERYVGGAWKGDLDEWSSTLDQQTRQEVTETGPGCLRRKCPNFAECAAFNARGEAAAADIVVSNHALTLLSLSSPQGGPIGIKPEESIVVFDEAHHIDSVLKDSQSIDLNINAQTRWAEQAATKIALMFESAGSNRAAQEIKGLRAWDGLIDQMRLLGERVQSLKYQSTGDAHIHRFRNSKAPDHITAALKQASGSASAIAVTLDRLIEQHQSKIDSAPVIASQLRSALERIYTLGGSTESLSKAVEENSPKALWVEKTASREGDGYSIKQKPLDVSKKMQGILWDKVHASIVTSATITALGEFDDFSRRVGLADRKDVIYKRVGSPFDYQRQGEINLLPMNAEPQGKAAREFEEEVIRRLPEQFRQTRSALVLFTSRGMMLRALKAIPPELRKGVLSQDDFGKRELLDRHKLAINSGQYSTIFGLASLAEGLDLPGKYLEHVVITKLQFGSPEDPVFQAHSEYLECHNRNPFAELSLPDASTKLVQAVGRLIRTVDDIGRVTIMDKRITTKRYGKQLLKALPPLKVVSTNDPVDLSRFGVQCEDRSQLAEPCPAGEAVTPLANAKPAPQSQAWQPFSDELPFTPASRKAGGARKTAGKANALDAPPSILDEPAVTPCESGSGRQSGDLMAPPSIF